MSCCRVLLGCVLLLGPMINAISSEKDLTGKSSYDDVVYGEDNRIEPFESDNPLFRRLAKSDAAMISKSKLVLKSLGLLYELESKPLSKKICEDQRFAQQIAAANCSGFLVASDLIMTAGHCVRSESKCDESAWVFDFVEEGASLNSDNEKLSMTIDSENVYDCKEVVAIEYTPSKQLDYAIIRLDRPVVGRMPLEVRTQGKISDDTTLLIMGHPSGLPMKLADGATVRKNSHDNFFVTNTDSFGGNSGSAIINAETGVVEGILVRGEQDYKKDYDRDCYITNICESDECRGEDATRITAIKDVEKYLDGTYLSKEEDNLTPLPITVGVEDVVEAP